MNKVLVVLAVLGFAYVVSGCKKDTTAPAAPAAPAVEKKADAPAAPAAEKKADAPAPAAPENK